MTCDPATVGPKDSLKRVIELLRRRDIRAVPVVEDGKLIGIVTDRDLLACLANAHDPYRCKISLHMHRPVHVLRPDEDHGTAANVMHEKRIKRLPIAENGKLLGVVSLSDLALIASVEADELRASLSFFTAVVRAQASQRHAARDASVAGRPTSPRAEFMNDEREMPDAGGPG